MSESKNENPDTEALAYLFDVIETNRDRRCNELREAAVAQRKVITRQAHASARARMHRHVTVLREKHRERVTAAHARNQTLVRRQHQASDKALVDVAWPMLEQALKVLWENPDSRKQWISTAFESAVTTFMQPAWRIEHSDTLSEEEKRDIKSTATASGKEIVFRACDDIDAGIRIVTDGTVIDATLEGLLKQKTAIEAMLISRTKQDVS